MIKQFCPEIVIITLISAGQRVSCWGIVAMMILIISSDKIFECQVSMSEPAHVISLINCDLGPELILNSELGTLLVITPSIHSTTIFIPKGKINNSYFRLAVWLLHISRYYTSNASTLALPFPSWSSIYLSSCSESAAKRSIAFFKPLPSFLFLPLIRLKAESGNIFSFHCLIMLMMLFFFCWRPVSSIPPSHWSNVFQCLALLLEEFHHTSVGICQTWLGRYQCNSRLASAVHLANE